MAAAINPTWENIIVHSAAPPLEPSQQAGPGVGEQFELHRPARFLLHHQGARADLPATDNVADFHLDEVAATQLAVDPEVEQCPISNAAALIEEEADLPYLLRLQRALCADSAPSVPELTLGDVSSVSEISMFILRWPELAI